MNGNTVDYLKSLYVNFVQWRAEHEDELMVETMTYKKFFDEYHKYLNEGELQNKLMMQIFSLYSPDDDGELVFTESDSVVDKAFFVSLDFSSDWSFFKQYLLNCTTQTGLRE